MQTLVNIWNIEVEIMKIEININKTKAMIINERNKYYQKSK